MFRIHYFNAEGKEKEDGTTEIVPLVYNVETEQEKDYWFDVIKKQYGVYGEVDWELFLPELTEEGKTANYHSLVAQYIAEKYPNKDIEFALINNFNTGKEKYIAEYEVYQAYRIECKERAMREVYED